MGRTPAPISTLASQLDDASKSCVIVLHFCNDMRPSICWPVGSSSRRHAIVF
jgi:hypothetical protein